MKIATKISLSFPVKFKAFLDIEGNILEAKILMPKGTPFGKTEHVVQTMLGSLKEARKRLPPKGELVKNIQVSYGTCCCDEQYSACPDWRYLGASFHEP